MKKINPFMLLALIFCITACNSCSKNDSKIEETEAIKTGVAEAESALFKFDISMEMEFYAMDIEPFILSDDEKAKLNNWLNNINEEITDVELEDIPEGGLFLQLHILIKKRKQGYHLIEVD